MTEKVEFEMKTEILEPVIRVPVTEAEMTTLRMILADEEVMNKFLDKIHPADRKRRSWELVNVRKNATEEYEKYRGYPVSKGVK
jgi:hypothetical protein